MSEALERKHKINDVQGVLDRLPADVKDKKHSLICPPHALTCDPHSVAVGLCSPIGLP